MAIMMSQVLICAKQAVCSWGGFDLKPTFPEVIQALENLGSGKKHSGVISFSFKSRYMYMSNNICYPLNNINMLII